MHRITTTILIGLLMSIAGGAQIGVSLDSVYHVIKLSSVHSKGVNWKEVDEGFASRLKKATNADDSLKSFVYVFEQLNDNHSGIFCNGNYYSNFPTFEDSALTYIRPLLDLMGQNTGKFKAKILENHFLYLQVPSVQAMGDDVSIYAQMLSDTVSKYLTTDIKGIVLDLRLNGGGQYSSMAAGLAKLLGDTYLGGGVNADGDQIMTFKTEGGNILLNNYPRTTITHRLEGSFDTLPVALIIGPLTASSGSILAVSFKGRPRTIFIGENSAAGYSTSNDYFPFGNSLFLNLSTTNTIDRNNIVYKDVVRPDLIITGPDNFNSIEEDKKVQLALEWLKR